MKIFHGDGSDKSAGPLSPGNERLITMQAPKQIKALRHRAHFYINAAVMSFCIKRRQMIIHSGVSTRFNQI